MKHFLRTLFVFLVFLGLPRFSLADQSYLNLGFDVGTYHFDRNPQRNLNEINPGVYVIRNQFIGGVYYNSDRKYSLYAAKVYRKFLGPFDLAVGGVTGYAHPVIPMVLVSYRFENVRITLIPLDKSGGGGLHLSMEF